jgi:hypothetical protein
MFLRLFLLHYFIQKKLVFWAKKLHKSVTLRLTRLGALLFVLLVDVKMDEFLRGTIKLDDVRCFSSDLIRIAPWPNGYSFLFKFSDTWLLVKSFAHSLVVLLLQLAELPIEFMSSC